MARLFARSAETKRVAAIFLFTMSNSAVFSFPRRVAAPGCYFPLFHPPHEGRAERRQAQYFCCRAVGRDDPRLLRRGARPAGRARLSALHRGDFGSGAALPSPAFLPDLCSELLAARSLCLAGGVPDLPGPAVTSRGRRTPLPAPPSARLRRRPLR